MNTIEFWIVVLFIFVVVKFSMWLALKISDKNKVDGIITVDNSDNDHIVWRIAYNGDPYELSKRDKVTFKIEVQD